MTCSPFDLKDYFLRELSDPQLRQVETHVKACQPCREELDRLRVTEAALLSVRDEEMPQRIAFVSDKIFEPSPLRRWWAAFWGSAARLGFASAAMLSAAIVVYALHPVAQPVGPIAAVAHVPGPPQQVVQTISTAEIQSRIDAAVGKAVNQAVTQAVNQAEARQTEKTRQLVADLTTVRHSMSEIASLYDMDQRREGSRRILADNWGAPHEEGK